MLCKELGSETQWIDKIDFHVCILIKETNILLIFICFSDRSEINSQSMNSVLSNPAYSE